MKELKKIRTVVMENLVKYPKTRANDNELVYRVLKQMKMPTDYSYLRGETSNIVETICRYRRKLQQTNPMLRPNKQVSERRRVLEEHFRKEMSNV